MKHTLERVNSFEGQFQESSSIEIDRLLSVIRRQWRVALICVIIAIGLGIAYAFTAVPIYTASARVIIDSSNKQLADQLSAITGAIEDDASILSQVELLESDKLATAVSEKLGLKDDAFFMAQNAGPIENAIATVKAIVNVPGWFKSGNALPKSTDQIQANIIETLEGNLRVTRVPATYVLNIEYSSASAELAAKIVQGYAESYLTDQLDSKYESTRRASDWLQRRIGELRQKALETDLAVQKFRAEKGLISSDGQLVTEQQLTQINTQLILAQSATASAQAKYSRIKNIVDSGDMSGAVSESLSSSVINDLRTKYLEASRKEADIVSRLGPKHVQAIRLKTEMDEYRRLMFDEIGRIAQSYLNDYQVALQRQKNVESKVAEATGVSATANDAQVQLRELEREADTYKRLYETFLQRYQEAVQQQSFPVTDARIISTTRIPEVPSSPKKPLVVALSILLGLMVGSGLGAFREFRDRFFRTSEQIRDILDLEPLGTVPLAKPAAASRKTSLAPTNARVISAGNSISNYVVTNPLSLFAETMRSAKIAVDVLLQKKRPKLVGIVSALPGEGKSTISVNFAELLASQGARVLLIDADLRNPGATRQIARHAERGIIEALEDSVPIRDLLMIDPETKLAFLPAVLKRRIPHSSELLASDAMDRILREISDAFDYIVFDLPPLAPVVDARAISSKLDAYLFVVEWGKTHRNVVETSLTRNITVAQKCAGVILNKVDSSKMKFYQTYGSSEYYASAYNDYYRE